MVVASQLTGTDNGMEANPPQEAAFVSAKDIAIRWSCTTETVFARLGAAGVTEYRFGTRTLRWRLDDLEAFEQGCIRTPRHDVHASAPSDGNSEKKSRRNFRTMKNVA